MDLDKNGLLFTRTKLKKGALIEQNLKDNPPVDPIYSIRALHDAEFVKGYHMKWGTNPDHLVPSVK